MTIIAILISMLMAFPCQQELWKGSIHTEKGVQVIENPEKPIYQDNIFKLHEELCIKGADQNYIIGNPRQLFLDNEKNLYVLDNEECHIKVFNQEGRFLRRIGRKGVGPGEFETPVGVALHNKKLVIQCRSTSRLSYFDLEGTFLDSVNVDFIFGLRAIDTKGNYYSCELDHYADKYALRKYDAGLKESKIIATDDVRASALKLFSVRIPVFALTKSDRIVCGNPRKHEIQVLNAEGILIKRIYMKSTPIPIDQRVVDYFKDAFRKGAFMGWERDIPKYNLDFWDIISDEEGRLYLRRDSNISKFSTLMTFDVLDPDGKYLTMIKINSLIMPYFANQRVYTIEEDAEGLPLIKISRITWKY
ncbi:MAG: 6-bladed beta-propeller [Candidatus Altiarchaeota archaeon]|nr:6-bladed beta-propeller [Candidatus Altiarchaeota archaeon]